MAEDVRCLVDLAVGERRALGGRARERREGRRRRHEVGRGARARLQDARAVRVSASVSRENVRNGALEPAPVEVGRRVRQDRVGFRVGGAEGQLRQRGCGGMRCADQDLRERLEEELDASLSEQKRVVRQREVRGGRVYRWEQEREVGYGRGRARSGRHAAAHLGLLKHLHAEQRTLGVDMRDDAIKVDGVCLRLAFALLNLGQDLLKRCRLIGEVEEEQERLGRRSARAYRERGVRGVSVQ